MHIDDFVVLGRTVPEESKRYGQRICMAGYSPENNQFLRVYPLMVPVGENADTNGFRARCTYSMDLQRNPNDSRSESWRLVDEKQPTGTKWDGAIECPKQKLVELLKKRVVPSIRALNDCKLSLGVVQVEPNEWDGFTIPRDVDGPDESHRTLFEDLEEQGIDPNAVKFAPYIRFRDAEGEHKLQVREWGAYRLLSNPVYADTPEALWGASGYRRGRGLLLVVGNMCNHRSNWLIIKTFELDAPQIAPSLLDGFE